MRLAVHSADFGMRLTANLWGKFVFFLVTCDCVVEWPSDAACNHNIDILLCTAVEAPVAVDYLTSEENANHWMWRLYPSADQALATLTWSAMHPYLCFQLIVIHNLKTSRWWSIGLTYIYKYVYLRLWSNAKWCPHLQQRGYASISIERREICSFTVNKQSKTASRFCNVPTSYA